MMRFKTFRGLARLKYRPAFSSLPHHYPRELVSSGTPLAWRHPLDLLHQLEEQNHSLGFGTLSLDLYHSLISHYTLTRFFPGIIIIYRNMIANRIMMNSETLKYISAGLCATKGAEGSESIIDQLLESGISAEPDTYFNFISALPEKGAVPRVLKIYQTAKQNSKLNTALCESILSHLSSDKQEKSAQFGWEMFLYIHSSTHLHRSVSLYTHLFRLLSHDDCENALGKLSEAKEMFFKDGYELTSYLWDVILEIHQNHGSWDTMCVEFTNMGEAGMEPNQYNYSRMFSMMMKTQSCRWNVAWEAFKVLREKDNGVALWFLQQVVRVMEEGDAPKHCIKEVKQAILDMEGDVGDVCKK